MAANDLYKAEWEFAYGGQAWEFGIHYWEVEGTKSPTSINEAAELLEAAVNPTILDLLSSFCQLSAFRFRPIKSDIGVPLLFNYGADHYGLVLADMAPANLAAVVRFRTTAASGRNNGRLFFSGFSENGITAGVLGAGTLTDFAAFAAALIADIGPTATGSLKLRACVLNRFIGGVVQDPPITSSILSASTQSTLYNQRRRRRKALGYYDDV